MSRQNEFSSYPASS